MPIHTQTPNYTVLGLTTDSALKLPFFRHYLASIGTVPASSHVAKKWLDRGWSIGISSGGVAEIFEANNPDEGTVGIA